VVAASGGSERVLKKREHQESSIGGAKCFIQSLITTALHGPSFPWL
jgi:hypothetical protein